MRPSKVEFYSESQVVSVLETAVARFGSAHAMARAMGLVPSTVHRTLSREHPPRGPVLARCGFAAVVGYARSGVDEFVPIGVVTKLFLEMTSSLGTPAAMARTLGVSKASISNVRCGKWPIRGLFLQATGYELIMRYARLKDLGRLRGFEIVDDTKRRPDRFTGRPKRHKSMHQNVAAK